MAARARRLGIQKPGQARQVIGADPIHLGGPQFAPRALESDGDESRRSLERVLGISGEIGQHDRQRLPHFERDRIMASRVVESNPADAVFFLGKQSVRHGLRCVHRRPRKFTMC